MKRQYLKSKLICGVVMIFLAAATNPSHPLASDKVSVDEVVAKHLESIGPAETRASIKTRIVSGTVLASYRAPRTANFPGKTIMASEGSKNFIGMSFENSGYAQEKFAFDGQEVTIGLMNPGDRSNLADFLLTHKGAVKLGLLGGTLSSAWPLLNLADQKVKLSNNGSKKINGVNAIEIKFTPKSGPDLEISLFFDQETYRHIRTEYTRLISAGIGANMDASGGQRSTRYRLTEDFSDFSKEGGLTLPHSYKISLELDTRGGTFTADWAMKLTQFDFNQPIPASTFRVQ
jgi:hypothetical protein